MIGVDILCEFTYSLNSFTFAYVFKNMKLEELA